MKNPVIIILLVLFGFVSTFLTGFYLATLLQPGQRVPSSSPHPSGIEATGSAEVSSTFIPDKFYFDDTVIMTTKDEPRISVVATVNRSEVLEGYVENTRVSYFDGKSWVRKTDSKKTNDSAITTNGLLKKWNIVYDPSRVLKQSVNGGFQVDSSAITFATGELSNEIGMRSLPGYTKFMSRGSGVLTINGTAHDAQVLYTRIYSSNASDIQFYDTPLGVTTDWIAFWDQDGNFYHVDKTSVEKPTPIYKTHEIGVLEDVNGRVTKTFSVGVKHEPATSPKVFTLNLGLPVNATLKLNLRNQFNKYPGLPYTWYMGQVDGELTSAGGDVTPGFGLAEYVHD